MLKDFVRGALTLVGLMPKPDLVAQLVVEQPEEMVCGRLYVVAGRLGPKWAAFLCPCGCGERVLLSLSRERRPRWSVDVDWFERPTIAPSVRQTDGCMSHYWVKKGKTIWCHDTYSQYCEER